MERLTSYQRELRYLRQAGAGLAARYPDLAGHLSAGHGEAPDPRIERLIESCAFLASRIQQGIDADFPLIPAALLDALYPHLTAPTPGMAIARLSPDPHQRGPAGGLRVERGTPLTTQTRDGAVCRFRTTAPAVLWPVEVVFAGFEAPDRFEGLAGVDSVLRLRIEAEGDASLADMGLDRLRLFLHSDPATAGKLHELIFGSVVGVRLMADGWRKPVTLPVESIQPVGFADDEDALPHPAGVHPGHRLLREYFAFPRKFLFFDIDGLDRVPAKRSIDILLLLDRSPGRLPVDAGTFVPGCTPIVNLFPLAVEPVRIDHARDDDLLRPAGGGSAEIHSILRVAAKSGRHGEEREVAPYFGPDHGEPDGPRLYWHGRRVPSERPELAGSDMRIAFLDLDFTPAHPARWELSVSALCTDRGAAERIPEGAVFDTGEAASSIRAECLTRPTRQGEPPLGGAALWRLVSLLSSDPLSPGDGPERLNALRESLRLCAGDRTAAIERRVLGIRDLRVTPAVRRIGRDAWRGFCRGREVTLTVDEDAFAGDSAILLGAVLSRFLALHAPINSFIQLAVESDRREGVWKKWPPMSGDQTVR
ncbi:MAG: type VI secretion system baseplate subunit TssF [Alphaproteobacteria bacterium]|nr:type VI secretion system baseplate subunit TssF [Alphaproteobacteria bacterium]